MRSIGTLVAALLIAGLVACGSSSGSSGSTTGGANGASGSTGGTTGTTAGTTTTGGGDATVIVTNLSDPGDLLVTGSGLFVTSAPNGGQGSVLGVGLSGGSPTTLVSTTNYPHALASDGTKLYWMDSSTSSNDDDEIMSSGLDGSGASAIVTGATFTEDTRLFALNGALYWGGQDGVDTAPVAGGASSVLVPAIAGAQLYAADSTGLYWSGIDGTTFAQTYYHAAIDGSGVVTLASFPTSSTQVPHSFAEDGTNAYWLTTTTGTQGTILWSVSINGGTATQVLTYTSDADQLIADASGVYFADTTGGDNGIFKVTGSTYSTVQSDTGISTASGQQRFLRLDSSNIYSIAGGINANQAVLHKAAR